MRSIRQGLVASAPLTWAGWDEVLALVVRVLGVGAAPDEVEADRLLQIFCRELDAFTESRGMVGEAASEALLGLAE